MRHFLFLIFLIEVVKYIHEIKYLFNQNIEVELFFNY